MEMDRSWSDMDAVKWEPSSMMGVGDDLGVADNLLDLVKGEDLSDDIIPQGKLHFRFSITNDKI